MRLAALNGDDGFAFCSCTRMAGTWCNGCSGLAVAISARHRFEGVVQSLVQWMVRTVAAYGIDGVYGAPRSCTVRAQTSRLEDSRLTSRGHHMLATIRARADPGERTVHVHNILPALPQDRICCRTCWANTQVLAGSGGCFGGRLAW